MRTDEGITRVQAQHKPPHVYVSGNPHMITAATHRHAPLLRPQGRKDRVHVLLVELCAAAAVTIIAWVVLDNHYHAVLVPEDGEKVGPLLAELHNRTSTELNEADHRAGRQVWYSHWDRVLRTEGDLYSRINYIHRNPVKHGYVEDAIEWEWSSIHEFLAREDQLMTISLAKYPAPRNLPGDLW